MQAMVLRKIGAALEWTDLAERLPGPGQIRVKVSACGVCRTDLHVVDGELPDPTVPIIPGHEIVGRIDAIGSGVDGFALGERVGIPGGGGIRLGQVTEPAGGGGIGLGQVTEPEIIGRSEAGCRAEKPRFFRLPLRLTHRRREHRGPHKFRNHFGGHRQLSITMRACEGSQNRCDGGGHNTLVLMAMVTNPTASF